MAAGFHHAGPVGTRLQEFGYQGIRHVAHIVPVGAYRGYGGNAQQGEEFVEHALFFVFDVVLQVFAYDFFHRSVRFFLQEMFFPLCGAQRKILYMVLNKFIKKCHVWYVYLI